jgi:hypothetical protein
MPLPKPRFRSNNASAVGDQVHLKSSWVVTSLRHPALRLLCCLVHLVLLLHLGGASPLLTSLQSPAQFPVYGDLAKTVTSGFTWQKLVFQSVISVTLLLSLRLVAYPRLPQYHWNWERSYRHATQAFSRLSRASAVDTGDGATLERAGSHKVKIALHTCVSGGSRIVPLHVWNVGSSHGSWTFVAAAFPFLWTAVTWVIRRAVRGSAIGQTIFPEDQGDHAWTGMSQLGFQKALSTALLVLSCLKLLVTLDWVLQDREYSRVFYGNWLSPVRRVYGGFPVVRLLWCWLSVIGLAIGGVYFGAISTFRNEWTQWSLGKESGENGIEQWLSNVSWHLLLCSLAVALDLLWLVQDWTFPSFASPVGCRMFGLHVDEVTLKFPLRFRLSFVSKWTGGSLVLALLLPLEICQLMQIGAYSPHKYAQYVSLTTFRILPENSAYNELFDSAHLDATSRLMLQAGSLSRYFPWSNWDRVPAFAILLLATAALLWHSKKECCTMCFAVFLGLPDTQEERSKAIGKLDRGISATTKHVLKTQQRLRTLYKLRTRSDSFCIALAGLSVLTVWLQFRAIWRSSEKYHRDLPLQSPGETCAALLLIVTLILLHQVHYRYCVKMEIMALRNQIPPDCRHSLWKSPRLLLLPFLSELLLCGICLPPLLHGRVYLDEERFSLPRATLEVIPACPRPLTMTNTKQACELQYSYPLEIVNMVVLVRLYWFVRVVRNQLLKQLTADKFTAVGPTTITGKDAPLDSLWWTFRIWFALKPTKVLLTLFVTLWVSTAAAVSIFERPFPSKLDGEDHALWLTLVTMTGVGYGDAYPITSGGRIAIVLGAVVGGLAFLSLMTSEFLDSLKGTKREHAVLSAMDRINWQRALRASGAELIRAAWQRCASRSRKRAADRVLLKAAYQFKLCRKRKPMHPSNSSRGFEKSVLSAFCLQEVKGRVALAQGDTAAHLDALEKHMDRLDRALRPLTQER